MSVEEKDLCWLCSLLVSAAVKIPLVESVFIAKDEIVQWIYSTKSGKVKKRNITELEDKSALAAFAYFIALHRGQSKSSELVCVLVTKGNRVLVDWDKIDESVCQNVLLARCSVIQNAFEDTYNSPIYEVTIESHEGNYRTSFLIKRIGSIEQVTSPRLWYKVLSVVKVILRLIEKIKRRLVSHLKLEFLLSSTGDIYLYGCPGLTLTGGRVQTKKKPGIGTNYRFGTPEGLKGEEKVPINEAFEKSVSADSLPKLHKGISSLSGFDNPNFRELLALNYAKNKPSFQYQSHDSVFRTLDEEFLGDTEEEKVRMSTIRTDIDLKLPPAVNRRASKLVDIYPIHKEIGISSKEALSSSPTVSTFLTPKHKPTPSLFPISTKLFANGHLDPLFPHKKSLTHRRGESLRTKYYFHTLKQ